MGERSLILERGKSPADWAADDELLISLGRIALKRSMELAKEMGK